MTTFVSAEPAMTEASAFAGYGGARLVSSLPALHAALASDLDETVVVVGEDIDLDEALEAASSYRLVRPALGFLLIRRRVDASVLRLALHAGIRDVLKSGDTASLADALERSREVSLALAPAERVASDGPAKGITVTVFAAKGGCGKTTVATNLAVALARKRRQRVCIVDLDIAFGDVAISAQLLPRRTIADAVALAGNLDETAVRSLVTPYGNGVDAILAPAEPGAAETVSPAVVSELLTVLRSIYDVVVVDTPPSFSDTVLAAFDQTDQFVLLATLDVPAVKNLKLALETMDVLHYRADRWHVVINRSDSKVGLTLGDVAKALAIKPVAEIPSSRAVPAATNRGVPILVDQPRHAVSLAIQSLADSVLPAAAASTPAHAERSASARRRSPLLRRSEAQA